MDTSNLRIVIEPGERAPDVPDWAVAQARSGARRALELMRSPRLPDRLILTFRETASEVLGSEDRREVSDHTDTCVAISLTAAFRRRYGSPDEFDADEARSVIGYCAGYETALFALDAGVLMPGISALSVAEAMGAAGSGFRLLPRSNHAQAQELLKVPLRRIASLRREHGPAALWRAEVRRAIDDLTSQIRISLTEGVLGPTGKQIGPQELHALLDYIEGGAPWPSVSD